MICETCGAFMDYRPDLLEYHCPHCHYTHDLLDDYPVDLTEEEGNRVDCKYCGGDGLIDDITPCPHCDGEGFEWWLD